MPVNLDQIQATLREAYRLRNLNPNGAFLDLQVLDTILRECEELVSDHIELRRKHAVTVARSVEHASALASLLRSSQES